MSDNNQNNEPKFNEALAYEELRMIFVIAIETQDFQTLEARIAAWERKYPLDSFIDQEIVRRIKAILNKDFLQRLIGDYLAAKILHEQEKQQEAYNKLKEIIDTAKKTKDYSKAQKQIQSWKNDLYSQDLSLKDFNKYYKAKICTMLLMPSRELEKQEEASTSLKDLVDRSKDMDSEHLSSEISDWQNRYTLYDFPDRLQRELNGITSEVFESISQKTNQENALKELHEIAESDTLDPLDTISRTLAKYDLSKFDSSVLDEIDDLTQQIASIPVLNYDEQIQDSDIAAGVIALSEVHAIDDLKDILNGNSKNLDKLINWIYTNRGTNFSQQSIEKITKAFYDAGYRVPQQSSYSIPEIDEHLSYKEFAEIDSIREKVIVNYLGLLSQGEKISAIGSENLSHLNTHKKASEISPSESVEIVTSPAINDKSKPQEEFSFALPVFDNEPTIIENEAEVEAEAKTEIEDVTLTNTETLKEEDETIIQNIFTEDDLLQDPLATYQISSSVVQISEPEVQDESQDIPSQDKTKDVSVIINETDNTTQKSTVPNQVLTPKEVSDKAPITVGDDGKAKVLSPEDEENISKANNLSTYIIVATPMLEMALQDRYAPKIQNKSKDKDDREIQKNNGF